MIHTDARMMMPPRPKTSDRYPGATYAKRASAAIYQKGGVGPKEVNKRPLVPKLGYQQHRVANSSIPDELFFRTRINLKKNDRK